MSEKISLVDENNLPTGESVDRGELYNSDQNHHRVVHSLLYDPIKSGTEPEKIWVQQRSPKASYLPNGLAPTSGGHVNQGPDGKIESYETAIEREQAEEVFTGISQPQIGLSKLGSPIRFAPNYEGYLGGTKFVQPFIGEYAGPFIPSDREVTGLTAIPTGTLKTMARNDSPELHPEFKEIIRRQKRIAVIGTYSVGKTTLTNALAKEMNGTAVTENVRVHVREHFGKKGLQDLTPDEFIELEQRLFKEQSEACRNATLAIIDSTPIGCPIYLENYGLLAQNGHQFDASVIADWEERVRNVLEEYDLIVYLPPEIPYEDDGFRTGDQFRPPIDQGFQKMIKDHPRAITVRGYTPENVEAGIQARVQQVVAAARKQKIYEA